MPSLLKSPAIMCSFCCIACLGMIFADQTQKDSITIAELRDHMYFLSSDYLGGRVTGTQGYQIAANYAVSQFIAAGLRPVLRDSEGKETFFQQVPLVRRGYLPDSTLVVRKVRGFGELASGIDFKLISTADIEGLRKPHDVVFVGYGIEEPDMGWDDFESLELGGKIVVALLGVPTGNVTPELSRLIHRKYKGQDGWQRRHQVITKKNPAAIIYLTDDLETYERLPNTIDTQSLLLAYSAVPEVTTNQIATLVVPSNRANVFFEDQVYSPIGPHDSRMDDHMTFELKGVEIELKTEPFTEEFVCHNVLGAVEGTDQHLKEEYVVVTAHLDHIPPIGGEICNGADDNASGCAAVMEIAEAVGINAPRRSVLFVLFTGEDIGESRMGSKHFLSHCPIDRDKIMVNINLDMIGRTDSYWPEGDGYFVMMDNGTTNSDLRTVIEMVNDMTMKLPISFHKDSGGASDSKSFSDLSIPAVGFFSGAHKDLHTPSDEIEKISFGKVQNITQLAFELTLELADRKTVVSSK